MEHQTTNRHQQCKYELKSVPEENPISNPEALPTNLENIRTWKQKNTIVKKINKNIPSTISTPEDTPTKELKFKNIPLKIREPASPPNKRKIKDQQDETKPKRQFISTQVAAPLKRFSKINQRRSDTTYYIQNEQKSMMKYLKTPQINLLKKQQIK